MVTSLLPDWACLGKSMASMPSVYEAVAASAPNCRGERKHAPELTECALRNHGVAAFAAGVHALFAGYRQLSPGHFHLEIFLCQAGYLHAHFQMVVVVHDVRCHQSPTLHAGRFLSGGLILVVLEVGDSVVCPLAQSRPALAEPVYGKEVPSLRFPMSLRFPVAELGAVLSLARGSSMRSFRSSATAGDDERRGRCGRVRNT